MADEIIVRRLDDLHAVDGEKVEADRRYTFVFEGKPLQLDLSEANAAEFERVFGPYLHAATEVQQEPVVAQRGKKKSSPQQSASTATSGTSGGPRQISKATAAKIREWALDNGFQLKRQGPLPVEIKKKFAAEHGITVDELR